MTPTSNRLSLTFLMGFIGVLAVGLGGIRAGSDIAAGIAFSLMLGILATGLTGMLVQKTAAHWIGFNLFGLSYAALVFVPSIHETYSGRLVTTDLLGFLCDYWHPDVIPAPAQPVFEDQALHQFTESTISVRKIGEATHPELYRHMVPTDIKALERFKRQAIDYDWGNTPSRRSRDNARTVGHAAFDLVLALFGALVGRVLADHSEVRTRRQED